MEHLEPLPPALRGMRVLVVHDWLVTWAGSERCVEQILRLFPEADLVVALMSRAMRDFNAVTRRAHETWLGRVPFASRSHRWLLPLEAIAFASLQTTKYDMIISSAHAFAKIVHPRHDAVHVCYCHSPPRYLWDLNEVYRQHGGIAQRLALGMLSRPMRAVDRLGARRVQQFIANSETTRGRIRRAYERDAIVVYPPVEPKPDGATTQVREDFVLYLGRLVPYKRVDLVVLAANRLGIKLVIAGDGPERARLEQLGGPLVEFRGAVGDQEAGDLYSRCQAFVFCGEEDFGIAPLEANAHGAPVVAYRAGGLAETMVDGVTAEMFDEQTVDGVVGALERALGKTWDQQALITNARRYAPSAFRTNLLAALESVLP